MSAMAQDSLRWNKEMLFYFRDGSLGNLYEIKEVARLTIGAWEDRRSFGPTKARAFLTWILYVRAGLFAVGEMMQSFLVAQHDALPAAFDESLLLPGAEDPADSVQRGPRHLGDVLAADRKVDLDAGIDLSSRLLGQAQQHMRDALLDLLVRHLHDAGLRILQAAADGLQRARGEA